MKKLTLRWLSNSAILLGRCLFWINWSFCFSAVIFSTLFLFPLVLYCVEVCLDTCLGDFLLQKKYDFGLFLFDELFFLLVFHVFMPCFSKIFSSVLDYGFYRLKIKQVKLSLQNVCVTQGLLFRAVHAVFFYLEPVMLLFSVFFHSYGHLLFCLFMTNF